MCFRKIRYLTYGIFARVLSSCITPKKKHWVFGSNFGKSYGEGPRCVMEYVMQRDNTIKCTWITKEKDVYRELKKKGIRCCMNDSIRGVWEILRSDVVFTSHSSIDVCYAYNVAGRRNIYLVHGQATKACRCASTVGYYIDIYGVEWKRYTLKMWILEHFCSGFWAIESEFISYTSDYVREITKCCFPSKVGTKILGSPRNDIMFDREKMHSDFLNQFKGKFIVTYMPTHRLFGKGGLSPRLFSEDAAKQEWLRKNDVAILIKQHPNMIPLIDESFNNDVVIDISKCGIDPVVITANSDVLISDYSSVWLDYMILQRPVAHYIYDDFSTKDQGIFEDLYKYPGINMFTNENELFDFIKRCRENYDSMKPLDEVVHLFHKYVDGNSSQRYYEELVKMYQ